MVSCRRCHQSGGHVFRNSERNCPKALDGSLLLQHQLELLFVIMVCSTPEGNWDLLGLPVSSSVHPRALPVRSPPTIPGHPILVKSICSSFLRRGEFLSVCHFSHSSDNIYQATGFKCQLDFCSHFQGKKIYKEKEQKNWQYLILEDNDLKGHFSCAVSSSCVTISPRDNVGQRIFAHLNLPSNIYIKSIYSERFCIPFLWMNLLAGIFEEQLLGSLFCNKFQNFQRIPPSYITAPSLENGLLSPLCQGDELS